MSKLSDLSQDDQTKCKWGLIKLYALTKDRKAKEIRPHQITDRQAIMVKEGELCGLDGKVSLAQCFAIPVEHCFTTPEEAQLEATNTEEK